MSDSDRHVPEPLGEGFVDDLETMLNASVLGPGWEGYHVGVLVPGVAVWAQLRAGRSGKDVLAGVLLLAPAGAGITGEQLRKVPVAALENAANLSLDEAFEKVRERTGRLAPLVRADAESGEEFSALVAEHYKAWAAHVPHPAAAMAAEWKVKPATIHSWIREARLRGLLPQVRRGKAG